MSPACSTATYYIGWDVGGWNCDNNGKSRDAICILDNRLSPGADVWRGSLRQTINDSQNTADWVRRLFALCNATPPASPFRAILAIDAPMGFSAAFLDLVTNLNAAGPIGDSATNPYLFRRTERFLFENGITPLSAVKDMIGSQATKAKHVLAKLGLKQIRCGVWSAGVLAAIEAYPSPCRNSETMKQLQSSCPQQDQQDKQDALVCALTGYLYDRKNELLAQPEHGIPDPEGWIWVPKDVLKPKRQEG